MSLGRGLRASLEHGFPIGDTTYPWGIELAQLEADWSQRLVAAGRPPVTGRFDTTSNTFDVAMPSVFGIPAVSAHLWSPNRKRPVVWVMYELPGGHGLEGHAGLAAMRPLFDAELTEVPARGTPAVGAAPNPHLAALEWTSGTTVVRLSAFFAARTYPIQHGTQPIAASVRIEQDQTRLLKPYHDAKRSTVHAWQVTPGVVEIIDAPGLKTGTPGTRTTDEAVALLDDVHDTPSWVADRLGAEQVAIWDHAAAGVWGFGDRRLSTVFEAGERPHLTLLRLRGSRREGYANLGMSVTSPGPDGLDALARALVRRAVPVRVTDASDE